MEVKELGHVVLMVSDRAKAEAFYTGVLGLEVAARLEKPKMAFFTLGKHHDLAVMELGEGAPRPARGSTGLNHVAFKIGDSTDELREAKSHLESAGVEVMPVDHVVTQSLYFDDPDGNGLEVFVDVSDAWRDDPQQIANIGPLEL